MTQEEFETLKGRLEALTEEYKEVELEIRKKRLVLKDLERENSDKRRIINRMRNQLGFDKSV